MAVAAGAAAVASPQLRHAPEQLLEACTGWATVAVVFEALSITGFVLIFKLAFAGGMGWRASLVGALRGLGASGLLPAGGLIGPAAAASSVSPDEATDRVGRSAVAFVIVTNVPGVVAVVALGVGLALHAGSGPHDALRTLVPAAIGLSLVLLTAVLARASGHPASPQHASRRWWPNATSTVRGGASDACSLLRSSDWKLVGALAYYVFDNALLWAAFRASGHAPPVSVVAMGYVVGSLGSAIPIPGGFGATEGGLIGALVLYGAPPGPAAAAVLLYRGITLLFPTLLGALAWVSSSSHRHQRHRAR